MSARLTLHLPAPDEARLTALIEHARRDRWAERLFDRDTSLWSQDFEAQDSISQRLGWLDAPANFLERIPALEGFGRGIRVAGFDTAVVMGMGGSSLAPDVLHRVFGAARGHPRLRILDSTDPAAVASTVDDLDPLETLWIVASKSGTTTEPLAFMADAWERVRRALEQRGSDQRPGEFFVAITDPGRSLEAIPHHDDLRERFLNPPDVGGRYSALTYVGLVPAAIIGLDLDALLAPAAAMLAECREPGRDNPGLLLGLAIGELARAGRDKLTLLPGEGLEPFGAWAEQLIAESTGKHGLGIVPVDLEPRPDGGYGSDRAFVALSLAGAAPAGLDELSRAGHPLIRIELDDAFDLAAEFVRWEVGTAFAGAVLGIDPFDQPNVEEAKEHTRRLLARADGEDQAVPAAGDEPLQPSGPGADALAARLADAFRGARPPAYLAIQAFIAPTPRRDRAIARLRAILGRTGCATTAGYGPRFLHSTGQLHKGGPATGRFLQLTADHPADRRIPGWPYSFGRLIDAQARGDREALRGHRRPVTHVHLGADADGDLAVLEQALRSAIG